MTYGYPATTFTRRTERGEPTWRRLDWVLIIAALTLSLLGAVLVWSATRQKMVDDGLDPQNFLKKHLLNLAIGLVLGWFVSRFDYRLLRAYVPILYVLSVLGLIAVLVVGSTINGTKAWISLPAGFTLQPSEFAKIAIIVGIAMILSEKRDAESEPRDVDVLQALALVVLPVLLIMLQPDLGTVLVIGSIVVGMIAVSGASAKWIVGLLLVAVVGALGAIQLGVLKPYQVDRLTVFANPEADPRGAGYNLAQVRIAIGSGGLTGTGLFEGPQTNGRFVPEQQTDFVYSVAGEELGFVGAGGIVLLLGIVLWRATRIALRAGDMFGRLVATGVACWFAFQAFENIGMNLGIMPVTGVPLPFVSYGGTSMFAVWIGIGLLQNVHLKSVD